MARSDPQVSDTAYPAIMQLARHTSRWLQFQRCLKLMEKSLWWCAGLLAAATVVHHSLTSLPPPTVFTLTIAPLVIAIFIGLVTGKVRITEAAVRCDQWLNSKQLYTTAVEYLTAGPTRQNRLAAGYVLTQAETLSKQWLPRVKLIQQWKPSAWLAVPLGISIAALFFQTLPGKPSSTLNIYVEAQLEQPTTPATEPKENLASRLETAFKQVNQQQLAAEKKAEQSQHDDDTVSAWKNRVDQPSYMNTYQRQFEATQNKADATPATASSTEHSSSSAGHSAQTGASESEALVTGQAHQPLADPKLEISYYELNSDNPSAKGNTASGQTQELSPSNLSTSEIRAESSANLWLGNTPLYDVQTSPRQRQYLNDYFNKLKAEQ
jgi:hypothetical protein